MSQTTDKSLSFDKSIKLSKEIEEVIPGGVDSPFRSFHEVGGDPIFFERAQGAYLFDVDGNRFIDYLGAWGPAILGHCPKKVVEAVKETVELGPVFGAPHKLELEFARILIEVVPNFEKVRFVNSGTEAVMSAIRLARGYTRKEVIVMFEGCYHGHSDATLASAVKSAAGVPECTAKKTVLAEFNNIESLKSVLEKYKGEVAAVIIEPVACSMGVVPPERGFLAAVEKLTRQHGALYILDEVITGFRLALGGAQEIYGVNADLVCFGKALGGGMPIGAYGGRKEIMDHLMPLGDVYQAGTFSGNPVTMAGGIATVNILKRGGVYERLTKRSQQFAEGLNASLKRQKRNTIQVQHVGSLFGILFSSSPVLNYKDSLHIDAKLFSRFFHNLLKRGVYLPPSSVDAACISAAHSEDDIEETVRVCDQAWSALL